MANLGTAVARAEQEAPDKLPRAQGHHCIRRSIMVTPVNPCLHPPHAPNAECTVPGRSTCDNGVWAGCCQNKSVQREGPPPRKPEDPWVECDIPDRISTLLLAVLPMYVRSSTQHCLP